MISTAQPPRIGNITPGHQRFDASRPSVKIPDDSPRPATGPDAMVYPALVDGDPRPAQCPKSYARNRNPISPRSFPSHDSAGHATPGPASRSTCWAAVSCRNGVAGNTRPAVLCPEPSESAPTVQGRRGNRPFVLHVVSDLDPSHAYEGHRGEARREPGASSPDHRGVVRTA